jgi:transcriptional regulator
MYVPQHFEETRLDTLHGLIHAHPLATLVVQGADGLIVNHVPMLLDVGDGQFGTLRCHVARANPVWQEFTAGAAAVAIFQGEDAYISPSWYPSKQQHGKAVPTWNYAVVHAHGVPRVIEDAAWLLQHVTQLSGKHEAAQAAPWQVSDAPPEYIDKLVAAIVGIEMPIARIEGKWKVSQNRPTADQQGIIAGLTAHGDDGALAMAALVGKM